MPPLDPLIDLLEERHNSHQSTSSIQVSMLELVNTATDAQLFRLLRAPAVTLNMLSQRVSNEALARLLAKAQ